MSKQAKVAFAFVVALALVAPVYAQKRARELPPVKRSHWYSRLKRLPLYPLGFLLRVTKLDSHGNFYDDWGKWPR